MLKYINYNPANLGTRPLTADENREVVEIINILLEKAKSESASTEDLLQRFINDHARMSYNSAFATGVSLNKASELILTAMGEASMAWSETPTGIFDDQKAVTIAKKLIADLQLQEGAVSYDYERSANRTARNLDEAKALFLENDDPVVCRKPNKLGGDDEFVTVLSLSQADDFFGND